MKAFLLHEFGPAENLIWSDVSKPIIKPDEVLIQSKSISINPIDVKTRSGKGIAARVKDQLPVILGWDISGVVAEVGDKVTAFKKGDAVFGMLPFPDLGKAYAEYVAAPASALVLKPENISHNSAAVCTIAGYTAWQALQNFAPIKKNQRVLIHAASGGVGHLAVQIAKHLGAYVIATSSQLNKPFVLSLGADEHIDYKTQAFENSVRDIDFVLDPIGGDYIDRSLKTMKKGGTIVCLPTGLNETVTDKAQALGMNGHTMRAAVNINDLHAIASLLEKGILKPHVSKIFQFEELVAAHKHMETGRTAGKIALIF